MQYTNDLLIVAHNYKFLHDANPLNSDGRISCLLILISEYHSLAFTFNSKRRIHFKNSERKKFISGNYETFVIK